MHRYEDIWYDIYLFNYNNNYQRWKSQWFLSTNGYEISDYNLSLTLFLNWISK